MIKRFRFSAGMLKTIQTAIWSVVNLHVLSHGLVRSLFRNDRVLV